MGVAELSKSHLLHAHAWIRLAASQLMSLYFGSYTAEEWAEKSIADGDDVKADIKAKVKELCFFFLSQLKDENLTKEIGNQATKNLIFLFRVVTILDPSTEENDVSGDGDGKPIVDKKKLSVRNLIRKVSQIAAQESANSPKESKKRVCVLRLIASVCLCLGEARLSEYLIDVLPAIHREISSGDVGSPLHTLAQEVLSLIQGMVSKDMFADVYGRLQKTKLEKKESQKRKLITDTITNPAQVALRKQKRNLAKRDQRKRKLNEKKPEMKLKKIRSSNDT